MEAAVMAGVGWVVAPAFKQLVDKCISHLGSDIAEEVTDLKTILLPQIEITIEAAEHSPREAQLTMWLQQLKDAYNDAKIILDDLENERLKREANGENKKLSVNFSSKPIIKYPAKFTSWMVQKASLLSPKKKKLLESLKNLKKVAEKAEKLHDLLSNVGNSCSDTTSLLTDKVFGRDEDRNEIIKFLLDEQGGSSLRNCYSVFAVTGMRGVGKTMLAQYVYNDPRLENRFDKKMWLWLSRKFDIKEFTKEMIECVTDKECPNLRNLNDLQNKLINTLPKSGKIMVVLDGVWYGNDSESGDNKWENLLRPFHKFVSSGGICKIVVTSRSASFPIALGWKLFKLSDLAPDDFKSLLRDRTIDCLDFDNEQLKNEFTEIVDEIAENMSKLPLAAKVIGNRLCREPDKTVWEDTLAKSKLKLFEANN